MNNTDIEQENQANGFTVTGESACASPENSLEGFHAAWWEEAQSATEHSLNLLFKGGKEGGAA